MGHNIKFTKFLPGITWFFVVLFLMCIPGSSLPKVDNWLNEIYFDKWIHTGVFGLLCILFCLPFNRSTVPLRKRFQYFIMIALMISIYGLLTEIIQKYWIPGRNYDLLDWAADTFGALMGFLYSRLKFTSVAAA